MTHAAEFTIPQSYLAGRELPRLGLGCARIGSFNNPASLTESQALCEHAVLAGVTLFDTADVYGQGDSERVLGKLLRSQAVRKASPIIVTKVGLTFSHRAKLARPLKPIVRSITRRSGAMRYAMKSPRVASMSCNFSPSHLRRACAGSLQRLGIKRLDALLLHNPPVGILAEGSAVQTLRFLRDRGDIATFGASIDEPDALNEALLVEDLGVLEITPHLLFSLNQTQRASIARRRVVVLLREVLRQAPRGRALYSVLADALSDPLVSTAVIGTTNRRHLDALVAAL